MTRAQICRFRQVIENRRRELAGEIRSHTLQLVINQGEHDPIDKMQSRDMREESATHLGRRSRVLAEINQSLQAMSDGAYGICVDCDEPISLKRLETIPWAPRCIRCQEVLEGRQAEQRWAA